MGAGEQLPQEGESGTLGNGGATTRREPGSLDSLVEQKHLPARADAPLYVTGGENNKVGCFCPCPVVSPSAALPVSSLKYRKVQEPPWIPLLTPRRVERVAGLSVLAACDSGSPPDLASFLSHQHACDSPTQAQLHVRDASAPHVYEDLSDCWLLLRRHPYYVKIILKRI